MKKSFEVEVNNLIHLRGSYLRLKANFDADGTEAQIKSCRPQSQPIVERAKIAVSFQTGICSASHQNFVRQRLSEAKKAFYFILSLSFASHRFSTLRIKNSVSLVIRYSRIQIMRVLAVIADPPVGVFIVAFLRHVFHYELRLIF